MPNARDHTLHWARKALADTASWTKGRLVAVASGEVRIADDAGLSVAYECDGVDRLQRLIDAGQVAVGDTVLVSDRWGVMMAVPRGGSGEQPAQVSVSADVARIEGGAVVAAVAPDDDGPEPELFAVGRL